MGDHGRRRTRLLRRGEVWWVDLGPARPYEADKRRPAVLVSDDSNNRLADELGRGVVTIVPFTTNTRSVYSFQVLVPAATAGLPADSKAQAEQVRSVSSERLHSFAGRLPAELLVRVDDALRVHLDL